MAEPNDTNSQDDLARLRHVVQGATELQARLGAHQMPDAFTADLLAITADHGLTIGAETLYEAMRPGSAPTPAHAWPGQGWLPARPVAAGDAPAFDWAWFGTDPIREPFFSDSVARMANRPFSRMFRMRTDFAALCNGAGEEPMRRPDGLIFHMSRCGSTLAAQVLSAVPDSIVMSEPESVNAVVQWARQSNAPFAGKVAALRAVVAALGRDRSGTTKRYFVKLDAWHTLALPLFRAAFPDVPWAFLYRAPEEVMVSHARMPGVHMAPGALPSALIDVAFVDSSSLQDYGARVLARICDAVIEHWPMGGGLLVNYRDVATAVQHAIPAHFGFAPDADEAQAMARAGSRDAKAPERDFASDSKSKRGEVTAKITQAIEMHLGASYTKLETMRVDGRATAR